MVSSTEGLELGCDTWLIVLPCTTKRNHRNGIALAGGRSGAGSSHTGCFTGKSPLKLWQTLNSVLVRGPIPSASRAVASRCGALMLPLRVFAARGDRERGK